VSYTSTRTGMMTVMALVLIIPTTDAFGELLANPGFDLPNSGLTPPSYPISFTGLFYGGLSSADSWYLWNNASATTTTALLPSTDPKGGGYMISVATSGDQNGLYQVFTNPISATTASLDVYVLSGTVELGLALGGGYLGTVSSTTTNAWQTLRLDVSPDVPNEIFIYSNGASGASFYADNASVPAVASIPEPSSLVISGISLAAVTVYMGRRRTPSRA
jgi:hypothetical protein